MQHNDLVSYIQRFSYPGIYLWFAIGEQLTPVPEEISLISIGYISKNFSLNPFIAGLASLAGLLSFDNFLFFISKKGNKFSDKLLRKINSKLLDKIKNDLKTKPVKTLTVMALVPKLRFISPIVSGISDISWKIFLLVNSIVTAFYVVVYMFLGAFFHTQLSRLFHKITITQHAIFIVFLICFAIFLAVVIRKTSK